MEVIIDKVDDFAALAHQGQQRKFKEETFINHPRRVMEILMRYTDSHVMFSAALLHDVLEDTEVTEDQMLSFLQTITGADEAGRILYLVRELTDVYIKSAYPGKNRRTRKELEKRRIAAISADAQTIKFADIADNCEGITATADDFAPRFLLECKALLKVMNKGNQQLKALAAEIIEAEMQQLEPGSKN